MAGGHYGHVLQQDQLLYIHQLGALKLWEVTRLSQRCCSLLLLLLLLLWQPAD
jgi:hypothetical protein